MNTTTCKKLTAEQVIDIRKRAKLRDLSLLYIDEQIKALESQRREIMRKDANKSIAADHGVNSTAISKILTRQTWRDI